MSLRVDSDRAGKSGRSRSKARDRSRSRDARAPAPVPAPKATSSSQKKAESRYDETSKDITLSMPGAFEPNDILQYSVRKPSVQVVTPGIATSAPKRPSFVDVPDSSDEDSDSIALREKSAGGSKHGSKVRSPHGIQMPSFPENEYDDQPPRWPSAFSPNQKSKTTGNAVPFPFSSSEYSTPYPPNVPGMPRMPKYPDDHTDMPFAQYAMPETYHYASPVDVFSYNSKPRITSTHGPPIPPNVHPQSPQSPIRSPTYPFTSQVKEAKPREQARNSPFPVVETSPRSPQSPSQNATYFHSANLRDAREREQGPNNSYFDNVQLRSPQSQTQSSPYPFQVKTVESKDLEQGKVDPYSPTVQPRSPQSPTQPSPYSYTTEIREAKPPEGAKKRASVAKEVKPKQLSGSDPKNEMQALSPSLAAGMKRLSVGGTRVDVQPHGPGHAPPASPLLEAYRGTYQSISPMPSPMMLPTEGSTLDDLSPLSPTTSATEIEERRPRSKSNATLPKGKHAKIYDASADAETLVAAMNHRSGAKNGPLVAILPQLTHDQLLELRSEYKKRYRVAGHGVNIAKHIKVKTTGNFGKACYVVALGRWESESYWANFWYQSHAAGRELLIESLMGRSNAELRAIKDSFRDKRYGDSLARCMEKELKPDKFRKAVLTALEEKRQEETDVYSIDIRNRDVATLYNALRSKDGGESAIIDIVVRRSDAHLREVLRTYERLYESNFAREALRKSNNLVGELLAHILNGIINRPVRDALLLHHALSDISSHNSTVQLRHELLISRLVRVHWDRSHLVRVRDEYANKYGAGLGPGTLERDVSQACKGEYGDFCLKLCEV